jgi:hypothetical protein
MITAMEKCHYKYTNHVSGRWGWMNLLGNAIVLIMIAALVSCSHDLDAPTPAPLETGTLSASKTEVTIDIARPSDEAVKFSWSAEKNTLIEYKLILTAGTKSDSIDVQTNTVSKGFTNAEFNNILLDKLGLEIGKTVAINVVVRAKVTINDKEASSNAIAISATPSEKGPAYTELWIVGDATPNGWNIDAPNVMVNDPTNIYQFKYNEVLNAGEFKIPVATGDWSGDFYMPLVNHPDLSSISVQLVSGGNPDNKWKIDAAGAYKILLNISNNPFIEIEPFTPYAGIYIIGDATNAGWDANNPIVMTVDPGDPNKFIWTGSLAAGQFRFLLSVGDLSGSSFVAPSADASITATQVAFAPDGTPANNFKVKTGEEGNYKITINQLKETISIVKQ